MEPAIPHPTQLRQKFPALLLLEKTGNPWILPQQIPLRHVPMLEDPISLKIHQISIGPLNPNNLRSFIVTKIEG